MKKINGLFGLGISILFVLLGLYLFFEKSNQSGVSNPTLIKVVGIACIIFFGGTMLFGLKKLMTK